MRRSCVELATLRSVRPYDRERFIRAPRLRHLQGARAGADIHRVVAAVVLAGVFGIVALLGGMQEVRGFAAAFATMPASDRVFFALMGAKVAFARRHSSRTFPIIAEASDTPPPPPDSPNRNRRQRRGHRGACRYAPCSDTGAPRPLGARGGVLSRHDIRPVENELVPNRAGLATAARSHPGGKHTLDIRGILLPRHGR